MDKQITISTTQPALYSFLNADIPEGAKIISEAPIEKRGIDWNVSVNVDINFSIDLTKITALAFATWLLNRIRRLKREFEHEQQKQITKINSVRFNSLFKGTNRVTFIVQ